MAKIHELKCWSEPFNEIFNGMKKFEFRLNDRNYEVGDVLYLRKWIPETQCYTGNVFTRSVTSILKSGFGLPEGYCIMSLGDY